MKPYLKAIAERLPRTHDARVKYTDVDRDDVLRRIKEGQSRHQIARDTGISRRTIQFWEHPERLEASNKHYKERGQARKSYERERGAKWAERMRAIRKKHIVLYGKKYGVKSRKLADR